MIRYFSALMFICFQLFLKAENPSVNYIAQYKQIAILEMQRTGIPASIKMAQALLESGAGRSTLARKANNHFGIKCGGSWNGETFYREDDDYRNGKLIKSCFRKFESAYDSFMAHSDFLTNQRRYSFLFELSTEDYKSWARGLRKAGYATDKAYAGKLIEIIEKYELYKLDNPNSAFGQDFFVRADDEGQKANSSSTKTEMAEAMSESVFTRPLNYDEASFHIVEESQTMADIAYLYEIDEMALRLRNRLPKDAEPLSGEKIHLRKKISLLKRPSFERQGSRDVASTDTEFIF
jgi:hypothetical protein